MVEQRSPKPPVACSSRVSPAKRFAFSAERFLFLLSARNTRNRLRRIAGCSAFATQGFARVASPLPNALHFLQSVFYFYFLHGTHATVSAGLLAAPLSLRRASPESRLPCQTLCIFCRAFFIFTFCTEHTQPSPPDCWLLRFRYAGLRHFFRKHSKIHLIFYPK